MSRRFPVWAVALIIGTLVIATLVAAAQDRRSPTTPTNLRITASRRPRFPWLGVHRPIRRVLVLRSKERWRLRASGPAADDHDAYEVVARSDAHVLRLRRRHRREPLGEQQHGESHHAAGHDPSKPSPHDLGDVGGSNDDLDRLDPGGG